MTIAPLAPVVPLNAPLPSVDPDEWKEDETEEDF